MNDLEIFHDRLKRIGIDVTFYMNYPWVYFNTINGKKVKGKYLSDDSFTVFFARVKSEQKEFKITDISKVFAKIRKTLKKIEEDKRLLKDFTERVKAEINKDVDTGKYIEKDIVLFAIDDVLNNFYK